MAADGTGGVRGWVELEVLRSARGWGLVAVMVVVGHDGDGEILRRLVVEEGRTEEKAM